MAIPDIPTDGSLWTKEFWIVALERAIRTGATCAAVVLVGDTFESLQVNAFTMDWIKMLGFGLGGFILSVLLSVGSNVRHGPGLKYSEATGQARRALPPDEQTQKGWEP